MSRKHTHTHTHTHTLTFKSERPPECTTLKFVENFYLLLDKYINFEEKHFSAVRSISSNVSSEIRIVGPLFPMKMGRQKIWARKHAACKQGRSPVTGNTALWHDLRAQPRITTSERQKKNPLAVGVGRREYKGSRSSKLILQQKNVFLRKTIFSASFDQSPQM